MVVQISLTDEEKEIADAYAKRNGLSLSEAMKLSFFEKLEDAFDSAIADLAINEHKKDPQTHSLKELMSELNF